MAGVNSRKSILMIAGEPSGDAHGAGVLRALRRLLPDYAVFGIGGEHMLAAGQEQLYSTREMAIMGFTEVIRHLPFLRRVFRHIESEVQRRRPACAILIDYPGFNLRMAERLKKLGVPVLYYIAPQVWAWGARRIPKMARIIDHLAVVFPFEVPLFENAGLKTTFVGHPLLERLQPEMPKAAFFHQFGLSDQIPVLGLLPGSRQQEVRRLLPDMLATAAILQTQLPGLQVVISISPDLDEAFYRPFLQQSPAVRAVLAKNATYAIMQNATVCLVSSGTATLETACFGTPLIIVYRVSRLSYALGKRLVKLDHIGLANIVAGEPVAPEFIQDAFRPEIVARELLDWLQQPQKLMEIRQRLQTVREKLGTPGASERVAKMAMEMVCPKADS